MGSLHTQRTLLALALVTTSLVIVLLSATLLFPATPLGLGLLTAPSSGPSPLAALCARTTHWNPNLTLHCHSSCGPDGASFCGGLANARDRLQTCLRLAVDAGATTLLVPTLAARSEERLYVVDPAALAAGADSEADPAAGHFAVLCADAWFGIDQLRRVLAAKCPRLDVRQVCPPPPPGAGGVAALVGADVVIDVARDGGGRFSTRSSSFRDAVAAAAATAAVTRKPQHDGTGGARGGKVLVEMGDPYMAWDYAASGEAPALRRELFGAVGFNAALAALGDRVVNASALLGGGGGDYVGVHLRGEEDWPAAWGTLEDQTRLYAADMVAATGGGVAVYVSCGNRSAIARFRDALAPLGFAVVVDKWAVLGDDVLGRLSFDEKAVVEYAPLVRARWFLGLRMSSMSYAVVTARTLDRRRDFYDEFVDAKGRSGFGMEMRGDEYTRLMVVEGLEDE